MWLGIVRREGATLSATVSTYPVLTVSPLAQSERKTKTPPPGAGTVEWSNVRSWANLSMSK